MQLKVVIIENQRLLALDMQFMCEDLGCEILGVAYSLPEAAHDFVDLRPDVAITNLQLGPHGDGVDVVTLLRECLPDLQVIFATGSLDVEAKKRMASVAPNTLLAKPVTPWALRSALKAARSDGHTTY